MAEDDDGLVLKTSWKRKEDRVNFFAQGAATSDFFDLLKAGAEQLINKTVHSGYLTKSGGKGIKQNWRKRWFVLTYDKYLYYYKTPQDTEPTGVICLTDYEGVTPEDMGKSGKRFRFTLHNNEKSSVRVFRLSAASQQEMLQWMASIEQVLRSPVLENAKTKVIRDDASDLILPGGVRRDCRLYIRIVEGKDFPKISSLNTYCLAGLDNVKQQRTQTVWKTREPLWSETFHLYVHAHYNGRANNKKVHDVRNPDGQLRLMCWRTGEGFRDTILGYFDVPLDTLLDQSQHDQWYPLLPPATQRYISGEVHLKVEYKPAEKGKAGSLMVQVVGGRNLAPKGTGGFSNPFIKLQFGKKRRKTKVTTKTLEPTFNEVFEFKLSDSHPGELLLSVWHQDLLKNVFMGQVLLSLSSFDANFLYDAWYPLLDNEGGDGDDEEEEIERPYTDEPDTLSIAQPEETTRLSFADSVMDEPVTSSRVRTNTAFGGRRPLTAGDSAPSAAMRSKIEQVMLPDRSQSVVTPPPSRMLSNSSSGSASRGLSASGGWLSAKVYRSPSDTDPVEEAVKSDQKLELELTGQLSKTVAATDVGRTTSAPSLSRSPPELQRGSSSGSIVRPSRLVPLKSSSSYSSLPVNDDRRSPPVFADDGGDASSTASSDGDALVKAGKNLGSIRLVLKYTEEIVLPISAYEPLLDAIVSLLGDVTTEREEVATALCRIAEHQNKAIMLISTATSREIDNTPNPDVIFRANTLATKALDYYMKLVGLGYLKRTIGEVIKEAYNFKKSFEVDPHRIEKGEDITKNFQNLKGIIETTTNSILNSVEDCPQAVMRCTLALVADVSNSKLRHVFHSLQAKVIDRYPAEDIEVTKYTAVSFFCAAILGPKLFDLEKEHPEEKTARILTLISKTVQNLSNLAEFGYKEPYMADMNEFITGNIDNMKSFIDSASTLPATPRKEDTPAIDFGRELATIHRHLLNNRVQMSEKQPDCPEMVRLNEILDELEQAKSQYIEQMS